MNDIASPAGLAEKLTKMFPEFAAELEGEEMNSYHQVIQCLAPVVTGYLERTQKRTVEEFCELVNDMVAAGNEKENAISTCLLEHASQVKVRDIIRPHLSAAAKQRIR
jgi:hypothetical protein